MAELHYRLRGDLDWSNAAQIQEQLTAAVRGAGAGLVIDCSELAFIDSSGMSALIQMQRALANDGRSFRVTNTSPIFRWACDAIGISSLFHLNDGETTTTERPHRHRDQAR